MYIDHIGVSSIQGPLVTLGPIKGASYDEVVEFTVGQKNKRIGRVIELNENFTIVQVFHGSREMSLLNTRAHFTGSPLEIAISKEILGRVFNGSGNPIDGLGPVYAKKKIDINGLVINPVARNYPTSFIQTGISAIDCLSTLIRGQKLPIFSGNGLPHDQLAVQIASQATTKSNKTEDFCVVFAAMGVKHDVADFFKSSFENSGAIERSVLFINTSSDPVVERIVTPRFALATAEYLAFECGMHVLVIMTDMNSYCEAVREVSSSKGEIPSRKGYPGYLYSDLASLYERAGMIKNKRGSITQIPILVIPNDDLTHPVPDLTGYITEGQIVLGRELFQKGIYPPISVLPSLSRLMKDGIGKNYTHEDHPELANQMFSSYAEVGEFRTLASIIGEDGLTELGKQYLKFGETFEYDFLSQDKKENRDIDKTFEISWEILKTLPMHALDRLSPETIKKKFGDIQIYNKEEIC